MVLAVVRCALKAKVLLMETSWGSVTTHATMAIGSYIYIRGSGLQFERG